MTAPTQWHARAFNQATESANQIHSDEMARAYGFKGGLVPGVTVSAYLMHPALAAWGRDWLERGAAHVEVRRPLYDGYEFDVVLSDVTDTSYQAEVVDQTGTVCAVGHVQLPDRAPRPPKRRNDPMLDRDAAAPAVSRAVLERMSEKGMHALPARWKADHNMATYLADPTAMPPIHRFDDGQGLANGAFLLGLTNWVLAGNTYMNPWVHLQTDSQFYAAVEPDTRLVVECAVADLFERKGHEFVDVDVTAFVEETSAPIMSATLRSIYRLRKP